MGRLRYLVIGAVWALVLPFVIYALAFGWRGIVADPGGASYLFDTPSRAAELALAAHMLSGAVITGLVPLQVLPALRRRWLGVHRVLGRCLTTLAVLTALGGLAFIMLVGTIGGPLMNVGFGIYGVLMLLAAWQAVRFARAGNIALHRIWALRFAVLALASWLYRLHYGLWYAVTDGLGSTPAFTGPFDQIQVFAFYVPYLLLLEVWRRRSAEVSG